MESLGGETETSAELLERKAHGERTPLTKRERETNKKVSLFEFEFCLRFLKEHET